jgi:hypothetical protein
MPERAVSIGCDRVSELAIAGGVTRISAPRPQTITGRPGPAPGRDSDTRSSSAAGCRSHLRGIHTRRPDIRTRCRGIHHRSHTRRVLARHIRPNVLGPGRAGAAVDHPNRGQDRGRGAVAAVGPIPERLHSHSSQASQWQARQ